MPRRPHIQACHQSLVCKGRLLDLPCTLLGLRVDVVEAATLCIPILLPRPTPVAHLLFLQRSLPALPAAPAEGLHHPSSLQEPRMAASPSPLAWPSDCRMSSPPLAGAAPPSCRTTRHHPLLASLSMPPLPLLQQQQLQERDSPSRAAATRLWPPLRLHTTIPSHAAAPPP
ncbi:hypothetical protein Tc00.1047053506545.10 [Trypanosoma cruzi]|uniref:Uncharacterized protein n=1 Tax=Trypanosoma cruzi (strain CL Brener) TaxID=353153 RepID=Q4CLQ3_TRYCC|nr:hypothetical protein Tc00.1047053506545.10 [Trypanosoma cruzi]EAN81205.1 hypothetical protein Tc00.1047053506545.10 [Trypanosoma cruzi]|eukprot:XP_802651.1 hypothetical protein [Trypanosoma cruzi strain CL Brener]